MIVLKLEEERTEEKGGTFLLRSGEGFHDAQRAVGFQRHDGELGERGCIVDVGLSVEETVRLSLRMVMWVGGELHGYVGREGESQPAAVVDGLHSCVACLFLSLTRDINHWAAEKLKKEGKFLDRSRFFSPHSKCEKERRIREGRGPEDRPFKRSKTNKSLEADAGFLSAPLSLIP